MNAATYERDGHVATITYNRPDALNAVNAELRRDLNAAWQAFLADEQAWVGVLTGAGERAFCAGADLHDGRGAVGEFPGTFWEKPTVNSFESGLEVFKPTIAAVNGHCIGYGFTAALFCDFIIAVEGATFGFPEVQLGQPTIVGAIRLPERVAWSHAMEVLLTGERFSAEHLERIGLVWKVVPRDRLHEETRRLAERLCQGAPLAVRATKEVAARSRTMALTEAIRFGETMRKVAGATADAAEGIRARTEGRPPQWSAE